MGNRVLSNIHAGVRQVGSDAARYVAVGALATGVDYFAFVFLVRSFACSPPIAQAASRALGGVVSFLGHRFWTFRYRAGPGFLRYAAGFGMVWLSMYGLSIVAIAGTSQWLPEGPVRAKLLADGAVGILAFLLQRHWTFRLFQIDRE